MELFYDVTAGMFCKEGTPDAIVFDPISGYFKGCDGSFFNLVFDHNTGSFIICKQSKPVYSPSGNKVWDEESQTFKDCSEKLSSSSNAFVWDEESQTFKYIPNEEEFMLMSATIIHPEGARPLYEAISSINTDESSPQLVFDSKTGCFIYDSISSNVQLFFDPKSGNFITGKQGDSIPPSCSVVQLVFDPKTCGIACKMGDQVELVLTESGTFIIWKKDDYNEPFESIAMSAYYGAPLANSIVGLPTQKFSDVIITM